MGRWSIVCLLVVACSAEEVPGTQASFDLDADLSSQEHFWALPFPSDLRLDASGAPDFRGFPNPARNPAVSQLLSIASRRPGFPVVSLAYFAFSAPLAARTTADVIPARADSPILLVDLETKRLYPLVASTLEEDDYAPSNLLAVAPRPGIVLRPGARHAYVVLRSLKDASGSPLGVPLALAQLANDETPAGSRGEAARALYEPLWPVLESLGIDVEEIAAATVFTTGDVVAALADMSTRVKSRDPVTIRDIALDADDGDHPDYCELRAVVTYPHFQKGTPPFDTDGLFVLGADGLPVKQREETAGVTITLPKGPMPAGGYPLMVYFHGSGGDSREGVDRGPRATAQTEPVVGEGPAHVAAKVGLAMATSALPLSPERLPGASDFAYLNLNNVAAFPDTFRQGVLEQRLFLEALRTLEISPAALGTCTGPSLPAGATAYRFDEGQLVALGLSMGGMYANLVSAVEPRIRAVAPTGAGGHWSSFILQTPKLPDPSLLAALIGTQAKLDMLHPVLQLVQVAWEWSEPVAFTPRLSRRPLPGHPVRPVYQPVGAQDSFFREPTLDAMAVSYANQQAGDLVWPELQAALALEDRAGIATYPVSQNLRSESGIPYTGVVVQHAFDGRNGHHLVFDRDATKHQWSCFLSSFVRTGVATVPAPDGACP